MGRGSAGRRARDITWRLQRREEGKGPWEAGVWRMQRLAGGVHEIFWIEEFVDAHGKTHHQLQYTQTVLLNFNGLSWPHVSVGNLIKV